MTTTTKIIARMQEKWKMFRRARAVGFIMCAITKQLKMPALAFKVVETNLFAAATC